MTTENRDDVDIFLEHYGVKGMKWGIRRDRSGVRPIARTLNNSRFGQGANRRAESYGRKQDAKLYGKSTVAKAKAKGGGEATARAKSRAEAAKQEAKSKNKAAKAKQKADREAAKELEKDRVRIESKMSNGEKAVSLLFAGPVGLVGYKAIKVGVAKMDKPKT